MILIVDDHVDHSSMLVRMLRSAGHTAMAVNSGAECMATLRQRKVSLVLLDVHMPEMDGLTILRAIKQVEAVKKVPVVMYTGDNDSDTQREAKKLGAADFFVKGQVSFDRLVDRISELRGPPTVFTEPPPLPNGFAM